MRVPEEKEREKRIEKILEETTVRTYQMFKIWLSLHLSLPNPK